MTSEYPVMIVTGGARGIGAGIVRRALAEGYVVVAVDVSFPSEETDAAVDGSAEKRHVQVEADVASEQDWTRVVEMVRERFGRIDVLVNNAGISPKTDGIRTPSSQMGLEEWSRVLDVNLTGAFLGCRGVYPSMAEAGTGRIVNISSQAGREGARVAGLHYGATKAALLGITRTLAFEWGGVGITVNAITPGRIMTPLAAGVSDEVNQAMLARIPVGRLGTGDDIAAAVIYLASPDAAFVTGATLDVNGGSFTA